MSKPSLKFMCSYGGRILPRYPDGKLRYNGGETRMLSVHRSISFSELMAKLGDMCGNPVILRCQLPTEDLDALVSITSDEDLVNLIEEYNSAKTSSIKIRAFLSSPKMNKTMSSPTSSVSTSSNDSTSPKSPFGKPPKCPSSASSRCVRHQTRPPVYAVISEKNGEKVKQKYAYHYHHCHGNGGHVYLVHNGNHWQ